MSTDVGTGGVTDPAIPRERVQAMAAGKQEVDRKSLRKEHAGDGWATPLPVFGVSSPQASEPDTSGEGRCCPSSGNTT